MYSMLLSVMN